MAAEASNLPLIVGIIASATTLIVASIGVTATYLATKRDRRRQLYGQALKAALGWHEMLYRVRRRQTDGEQGLVIMFHDLQEQLTYYQGWIGSESRSLERSYSTLVEGVKAATEGHIAEAWADPIRPLSGNAKPSEAHPDVKGLTADFLSDVRAQMSLNPIRRFSLWRRSKRADV